MTASPKPQARRIAWLGGVVVVLLASGSAKLWAVDASSEGGPQNFIPVRFDSLFVCSNRRRLSAYHPGHRRAGLGSFFLSIGKITSWWLVSLPRAAE